MDAMELLEYKVEMLSCSLRDGFRLENPDMDFMIWPNHHPVLWEFSQAQFYDTQNNTLILCDSTESPPGFTLLWLPLERVPCGLLSTCIRLNGVLYISSAKFRDFKCSVGFPNSAVHGSYSRGNRICILDYDFADCVC